MLSSERGNAFLGFYCDYPNENRSIDKTPKRGGYILDTYDCIVQAIEYDESQKIIPEESIQKLSPIETLAEFMESIGFPLEKGSVREYGARKSISVCSKKHQKRAISFMSTISDSICQYIFDLSSTDLYQLVESDESDIETEVTVRVFE